MPLFRFQCAKCKETSEILVRGSEKPVCPECGSTALTKQMSAFSTKNSGRYKQAGSVCDSGACSTGSCPFAS